MGRIWNSTLNRLTPLRRKKRINPVNRERLKRAQEKSFGKHADYIRGLPCCVCLDPSPNDPHHVKSRGAGGRSKHLVPLCRQHHNEYHTIGHESFEAKYEKDLMGLAADLADCEPLPGWLR